MCVIAVSPKGIKQPSIDSLHSMWKHNPHGAGYMVSRNGRVEIHKGFMIWADFIRSVNNEHFTEKDSVVYHFRISTQGGINEQMTHPFPLSDDFTILSALDVFCNIGIAHNGIIPITTGTGAKYSDTALFIAHYLSKIIRSDDDISDLHIQRMISELAQSKLAIMDRKGKIVTIGQFFNHDGILLSNQNHLLSDLWNSSYYYRKGENKNVLCSEWQSVHYGF